jgi:hypothetical protein
MGFPWISSIRRCWRLPKGAVPRSPGGATTSVFLGTGDHEGGHGELGPVESSKKAIKRSPWKSMEIRISKQKPGPILAPVIHVSMMFSGL